MKYKRKEIYRGRFIDMLTDKTTKLRFTGVYRKNSELYGLYVPDERKATSEAKICLTCTQEKCRGNCKRFEREIERIKKK